VFLAHSGISGIDSVVKLREWNAKDISKRGMRRPYCLACTRVFDSPPIKSAYERDAIVKGCSTRVI
jgi:hypothetical protein